MADYNSALNTSLGDYLSLESSRRGISEDDLNKQTNIEPIVASAFTNLSVCIREQAIRMFDEKAKAFDVVLEVRENQWYTGIFGIGHGYVIRATGVKHNFK